MKRNISLSILLSMAGIVAFLTIVGLAVTWIPVRMWTGSAIFSLLLFATAIAINIYFPGFFPTSKTVEDAPEIASIMPNTIIYGCLMIFSGMTFIVSLYGYEKISWTMNVIGLSIFTIMIIYNSYLRQIISDLPQINNSEKITKNWIISLKEIARKNKIIESSVLEKIIEEVEYSPSTHYLNDREIDEKISKCIIRLDIIMQSTSSTKTEILEEIAALISLIESRNDFLKNLRTKTL